MTKPESGGECSGRPPALAEFLLSAFAPRRLRDALLGDFAEVFAHDIAIHGRRGARLRYWMHVLDALGPLAWRMLRGAGHGAAAAGENTVGYSPEKGFGAAILDFRQPHTRSQHASQEIHSRISAGLLATICHVLLIVILLYTFRIYIAPAPYLRAPEMVSLIKTAPPSRPVLTIEPSLIEAPSAAAQVPQFSILPEPQAPNDNAVTANVGHAVAPGPTAAAEAVANGNGLSDYLARLSRHLNLHLQYPGASVYNDEHGTAYVHFIATRDGKVLFAELAKTSGYARLDKEAVAVIWRSQPLPPLPPELKGDQLNAIVPVNFTVATIPAAQFSQHGW